MALGTPSPAADCRCRAKDWQISNLERTGTSDCLQASGAKIWSVNWADGTVTKIQANDGAVLGTYQVEPALRRRERVGDVRPCNNRKDGSPTVPILLSLLDRQTPADCTEHLEECYCAP